MLKKLSSMFNYIVWLLDKQKKSHMHPAFKIVRVKNQLDNIILNIQVVNKSTIFQCNPIEIISDDNFLEKFSMQDIRTITYYATKELLKPTSQVISHRFEDDLKKTICKIKNNRTKTVELKSLSEIAFDDVNKFNQIDALRIGYLQAMEESIQENLKFFSKKIK